MSFAFLASLESTVIATLVVVALSLLVSAIWLGFIGLRARRRCRQLAERIAQAGAEMMAREGAEALMRAEIDQLRRQNDDLEQFAHIASHDLRAPLRAIANLAMWIDEDSAETLSTDSRDHLALLRGRVTRLQRLLRDLLSYARAGRGDVEIEAVDLSLLLAEISEDYPADQLALEITRGSGLESHENLPTLETAVAPLRQVLANLVGNAVKHHDRAQAQVSVHIARSSRNEGDEWLTITVTDDGPGIDPVLIPKALKMFQTLQSRDELESTGMGLALVKRLTESAGGSLELRSPHKASRGLEAIVRWPARWPMRAARSLREQA